MTKSDVAHCLRHFDFRGPLRFERWLASHKSEQPNPGRTNHDDTLAWTGAVLESLAGRAENAHAMWHPVQSQLYVWIRTTSKWVLLVPLASHVPVRGRLVGRPYCRQHSSRNSCLRWRVCAHSKRLVSSPFETNVGMVWGRWAEQRRITIPRLIATKWTRILWLQVCKLERFVV